MVFDWYVRVLIEYLWPVTLALVIVKNVAILKLISSRCALGVRNWETHAQSIL